MKARTPTSPNPLPLGSRPRGGGLSRLLAFVRLQVSAAVFGITILTLIMVSAAVWDDAWPVYRYDFLFVFVLAMQGALLAFGLETWREARVIFVFHIVGVVMEVFKTSVGSWVYPEPSLFAIGGVPLFTGFMYSAVGSYIARFWRLSGMRLSGAPPEWAGAVLALLIYVNFYSHHFLPDIRLALFVGVAVLYGRCWAYFPIAGDRGASSSLGSTRGSHRGPGDPRVEREGDGASGSGVIADRFAARLPVIALFGAVALLVYAAENIGSLSGTWLYPNQHSEWRPVPVGKLGSWFLLMIVSFTLVRAVRREG